MGEILTISPHYAGRIAKENGGQPRRIPARSKIDELKRAVQMQFSPRGERTFEQVVFPEGKTATGYKIRAKQKPSKCKRAAKARRIFCWVMVNVLGSSHPRAALELGVADHTSSHYGCKRVDEANEVSGFDPTTYAGTIEEWVAMIYMACTLLQVGVESRLIDRRQLGSYRVRSRRHVDKAGASAPARVHVTLSDGPT